MTLHSPINENEFKPPPIAPTPKEFKQERKEMVDKRDDIASKYWEDREEYFRKQRQAIRIPK